MEQIREWAAVLPEWARISLFLLIWFVVLGAVKIFVFSHLKKLVKKTTFTWDDRLVQSLNFPVWIFILATGIHYGGEIFVLADHLENVIHTTTIVLFAFGLILFLNGLLILFFNNFVVKHAEIGESSGLIKVIIRIFVWIIGVLILLDTLGLSITPFIASLGVGSIAVGLALQDTLANLFSGFYLMLEKPVKVGDFVKLESGEEGFIVKIGWRSSHVQMIQQNILVIPNAKLASSTFINYHLPQKELAIIVEVGVSYSSDLEKVEKVTLDVAKKLLSEVEGGVSTAEPFLRYHTFGDSSINFRVYLRAKKFPDRYLLEHEFIKKLHQRYREEGIEIPFPQRTLHLESIPEKIRL